MLGFMNAEAYAATQSSGRSDVLFSRSRTSCGARANRAAMCFRVREMRVDCDVDALLIRVEALARAGVCHEGYRSCFFRRLSTAARRRLLKNGHSIQRRVRTGAGAT